MFTAINEMLTAYAFTLIIFCCWKPNIVNFHLM